MIAVGTWLGTLSPTLLFGLARQARLALGIGLLCSAFDLSYPGLLLGARLAVPSRSGEPLVPAARDVLVHVSPDPMTRD